MTNKPLETNLEICYFFEHKPLTACKSCDSKGTVSNNNKLFHFKKTKLTCLSYIGTEQYKTLYSSVKRKE